MDRGLRRPNHADVATSVNSPSDLPRNALKLRLLREAFTRRSAKAAVERPNTPWRASGFTLDNELRVFASRSRCKNSVGLNALGVRGFSYCSWKFQSRSGVGGDDGEQVEGSGLRLGRHCALGNCGGRANGLRFAPTEREFGGAGPNGCAAWPRPAWTWRSYRATELHVMVLGPTSGRAGGRTLEGLCGSRDRPADRPTFSGWPMDQRRPRRSGREVASSAGREEAADERGQRLCAWRDARGRSSGPCADPSAGRAGGSGA